MDEDNFNKKIKEIFEKGIVKSSMSISQQLSNQFGLKPMPLDLRTNEERSLLENQNSNKKRSSRMLDNIKLTDENPSPSSFAKFKSMAPNMISKFEHRVISASKQKTQPQMIPNAAFFEEEQSQDDINVQ